MLSVEFNTFLERLFSRNIIIELVEKLFSLEMEHKVKLLCYSRSSPSRIVIDQHNINTLVTLLLENVHVDFHFIAVNNANTQTKTPPCETRSLTV